MARLVVELMPTVSLARDEAASGSAALLVRRVRPPRSRTIIVAAVARKSVEAPTAMWENPGATEARRVQRRAEGQGGSLARRCAA